MDDLITEDKLSFPRTDRYIVDEKACLPGANKAYLLRPCLKSVQNL